MKPRKLWLKVLIVIAALVLVVNAAKMVLDANLEKLAQTPISPVSLAELADGDYLGEYSVFPVKVKVSVAVAENKLKAITLLEHRNGQGKPAEAILGRILESQRVDVDVVAGASYSSRVIQRAIVKALEGPR